MEWLVELWRRVVFLFCRRQFEADLDEELRFHLEMKTEAYRSEGAGAVEARFAAMKRLGNAATLKERSKEMWGWTWFEAVVQDTRYALRVLRRSPAFALIAVGSLALGIGANTIVFSVLNALVLKPLPIAEPERIFF